MSNFKERLLLCVLLWMMTSLGASSLGLDPRGKFVETLRKDHSLVAEWIGETYQTTGKTCSVLSIDFSSWANGSILERSMRAFEAQVKEFGARDHSEYRSLLESQTRLFAAEFNEEFRLHAAAITREKKSLWHIVGLYLGYKTLDIVAEKIAAFFGPAGSKNQYNKGVEMLQKEQWTLWTDLRREIAMRMNMMLTEQRRAMIQRSTSVLNEMFYRGQVTKHLFQDDTDVPTVLKGILGSELYSGSVYEQHPIHALNLLEIQPYRRHGDILATQICAPIFDKTKSSNLFRVQPIGSVEKGHWIVPMVPEYVVTNQDYDMVHASRLTNPSIECKRVGLSYYCPRFSSMESQCNLVEHKGCHADSVELTDAFSWVRRIGEFVLVATTATEVTIQFQGTEEHFNLKEKVFAFPLPINATMTVGKQKILGSGTVHNTEMRPIMRQDSEFRNAVKEIKQGVFYPVQDNNKSFLDSVFDGLCFASLILILFILAVCGTYGGLKCLCTKITALRPEIDRFDREMEKVRGKVFKLFTRTGAEFSGWETAAEVADQVVNRVKKLVKKRTTPAPPVRFSNVNDTVDIEMGILKKNGHATESEVFFD